MNCADVETLLSAYAEGELVAEEAAPIEAHLRDCAECRAFLETLAGLGDMLRGETVEEGPAPEELRSRAARLRQALKVDGSLPRGEVWTPEEVAAFLKLPPATIYDMAEELPFFAFAGQLRLRREALLEWMEERERLRRARGAASWVRRVG